MSAIQWKDLVGAGGGYRFRLLLVGREMFRVQVFKFGKWRQIQAVDGAIGRDEEHGKQIAEAWLRRKLEEDRRLDSRAG